MLYEVITDYLKFLTYEGAKKRYQTITAEIQERIDFELDVIKKTGYPGYFLIVEDFIREARTCIAKELTSCSHRITSYNGCYTKLLREDWHN